MKAYYYDPVTGADLQADQAVEVDYERAEDILLGLAQVDGSFAGFFIGDETLQFTWITSDEGIELLIDIPAAAEGGSYQKRGTPEEARQALADFFETSGPALELLDGLDFVPF